MEICFWISWAIAGLVYYYFWRKLAKKKWGYNSLTELGPIVDIIACMFGGWFLWAGFLLETWFDYLFERFGKRR